MNTPVTPYSALPDSTVRGGNSINYACRGTGGHEGNPALGIRGAIAGAAGLLLAAGPAGGALVHATSARPVRDPREVPVTSPASGADSAPDLPGYAPIPQSAPSPQSAAGERPDLAAKGADVRIGVEPRPAADDRIAVASHRRRHVLQSWQTAASASLRSGAQA